MTSKLTKKIKDQNNFGKRLKFIRDHLEIPMRVVSEKTNINSQSLYELEWGVRTTVYERFFCLAVFYDSLWQERFFPNYPKMNNEKIEQITPSWIMFGDDLHLRKMQYTIKLLEENQKNKSMH